MHGVDSDDAVYDAAGAALQCYQCDSNEDESCPSWQPFDHNINALVDCMSFEAYTPGTFCLKVTRESPGCMLVFFLFCDTKLLLYVIVCHCFMYKVYKGLMSPYLSAMFCLITIEWLHERTKHLDVYLFFCP